MSGNRWEVVTIREYTDRTGQPRTNWTKIGAAFTNQNGSINVQLDAFPVDGRMQLQVPLTREEKEAKFGGTGRAFRQDAQQGQRGGSGRSQQPQQHRGQANNAQRYRGPQQQQFGQPPAPPPDYQPDPNGYVSDANEDPYPGSRIGANQWNVNGQIVNDARQLPDDHQDFIPF